MRNGSSYLFVWYRCRLTPQWDHTGGPSITAGRGILMHRAEFLEISNQSLFLEVHHPWTMGASSMELIGAWAMTGSSSFQVRCRSFRIAGRLIRVHASNVAGAHASPSPPPDFLSLSPFLFHDFFLFYFTILLLFF